MDIQVQQAIITTVLLIANAALYMLQRSNKNTLLGKIADLEERIADCLARTQAGSQEGE
jgi:hypothetical protein